MKRKVQCFCTPTEDVGDTHPKDNYGWIRNGHVLYRSLLRSYRLFGGPDGDNDPPVVFETFPHAASCAFRGEVVSARSKRLVRTSILEEHGVQLPGRVGIDFIDAAICALVAAAVERGQWEAYGDREGGFIVLPQALP
jgi:hypothetical protein